MFSRLRIMTAALVLAIGSPQWVIQPVLPHSRQVGSCRLHRAESLADGAVRARQVRAADKTHVMPLCMHVTCLWCPKIETEYTTGTGRCGKM